MFLPAGKACSDNGDVKRLVLVLVLRVAGS